ncbi:MAG TPA: 30S ribosomal protein S6 [bacterium]
MSNLLKYDVIYILDPNATPEEGTAVSTKIEQIVADAKETVLKKDDWGKRRLAYMVKKHREGHYAFFHLSVAPATIAEVVRNLRLMEKVIKFSVVRDEISHLKPKIKPPRKPGNPDAATHRPGASRTSSHGSNRSSYVPSRSSTSTSAPTSAPSSAATSTPASAPVSAPVSASPAEASAVPPAIPSN